MTRDADASRFVVFFSWQSDLPRTPTTDAIRECLLDAKIKLESDEERLTIILDEATRGEAGSPNIPQTVFQKVSGADAFVCDVTTINGNRGYDERPTPNPNVLVELGYAVATLGWSRIILLFNTRFGTFPDDLPFDIDRHRASDFSFSTDLPDGGKLSKKDKRALLDSNKQPLRDLLHAAIREIVTQNPTRPTEEPGQTPEERKRQFDETKLRELASTINMRMFDDFLDKLHMDRIPHLILHFWESFNAVICSSTWHLYDEHTREIAEGFRAAWDCALSFSKEFWSPPRSNDYVFGKAIPGPMSEAQEQALDEFRAATRQLETAYRRFIQHLREEYIDVDLDEASRTAWRDFMAFRDRQDKIFAGIGNKGPAQQ